MGVLSSVTVDSRNSDVIDSTRVAQMKDQICTLFLLKQPKVILNIRVTMPSVFVIPLKCLSLKREG